MRVNRESLGRRLWVLRGSSNFRLRSLNHINTLIDLGMICKYSFACVASIVFSLIIVSANKTRFLKWWQGFLEEIFHNVEDLIRDLTIFGAKRKRSSRDSLYGRGLSFFFFSSFIHVCMSSLVTYCS